MKTILLEIDSLEAQTRFVHYKAGIATMTLTQLGEFSSFDFGTSDYNTTEKSIESLTVIENDIPTDYTAADSIADCVAQNASFYFNSTTQQLYVHFDDYTPYWLYDFIDIGVVAGYSNNGVNTGTSYYPPRLITDGLTVEYEKDPLYAGLIKFKEYTFSLRNGDHELDDLASQDLYGNATRIKVGSETDDYADFKTLFEGRVSSVPEIRFDEVTVDAQDKRKFLSRGIPTSRFNQTDYPNLPDDFVGENIPIAFGDLRGVPLVPINTYQFKICDPLTDEYGGITSIDSVYVDGVEVTPDSQSLTDCTVTIDSADADREFSKKVTADITGYSDGSGLIDNGLYVLRKLLRIYGGVQYLASNYNTTEYDSYEATANDIALFVEDEDLSDVIEHIALSMFGIFYVQPDGKYSFKKTDEDRASAQTISEDDIISEPYAEYDEENFLTSVKIKYNKKQDANTYQRFVYDDLQDTIFLQYRQYREKEYETALTNSTDAEEMAVEVMDISKQIPTYFPLTVPYETYKGLVILDNVQTAIKRTVLGTKNIITTDGYLTAEDGDILTTESGDRLVITETESEPAYVKEDWYGDIKAEIIQQAYNLSDETIDLKLRLIEEL